MKICSHAGCEECCIYLEDKCWNHLSAPEKNDFPNKLMSSLSDVNAIKNETFHKVELIDLRLPEHCIFHKCDFTYSKIRDCIIQRTDFRGSDFSNAVIKNCHLEYCDFRGIDTLLRRADLRESHFIGALLQNVDLTGADLRDAVLINADMIGAMMSGAELYASRLMNTRLRKENFCSFEPTKPSKIVIGDERSRERGGQIPTPLRARNVYTSLKNNFRSIGEYSDERWARKKERKMERKRLYRVAIYTDRYSDALALERWRPADQDKLYESRPETFVKWLYRWFLTVFGYGESPATFLAMSVITVTVFAFLFMFTGFEYSTLETTVRRSMVFSLDELPGTIEDFMTSLYFSIVTFTTLGYGDAHPVKVTRFLASTEALLGFVFYSSFVASFIKRLSDQ